MPLQRPSTFRSIGNKRFQSGIHISDRVPPGQHVTTRWPVLHYGDVPTIPIDAWTLKLFGEISHPVSLTWTDFAEFPRARVTADMHCVTRWSRLDVAWEGVLLHDVLALHRPLETAGYVVFHGYGGYTTNVPLAIASGDDVLLATHADGEQLPPEHGFPVRAVVPQRYAWKSAKWLVGIEFLAEDRKGFWERYGYHNNGDFRREERFA